MAKKKFRRRLIEGRDIRIGVDFPPALVDVLDDLKIVFGFSTRNKLLGFILQDAATRVGTCIDPKLSLITKEQRAAIRRCRSFAAVFKTRLNTLSAGFYSKPEFALMPLPPFADRNSFDFDKKESTKKRRCQ